MGVDVIATNQSLLEFILAANIRAEELATSGEWEAVSSELVKRDSMLREIQEDEKEAALVASLRSTEQIRGLVEQAKNSVGKELGQIKIGREATTVYGVNS